MLKGVELVVLKKRFLTDLIDEVVIPFCKYLNETQEWKRYLDSEEKILKHKLDVSILTISLLNKPQFAKEKLQRASVAHNSMNIDHDAMREALNFYFLKIVEFLDRHKFRSSFKDSFKEYEEFFMEVYAPKDLEDDFFDFDSLDVDEAIECMHYKDEEKISAKEFMAEDMIEQSLNEDLEEICEMFDSISARKEMVDYEYIDILVDSLNSFIHIFNITHEFKDIAYALESLREFLKFDIGAKREEELKILKSLLDSVIEDLENWKREVLDEERAIDIHYLDASLLANVSQIEIMLSNSSQDEEIELF